MVKMSYLQMGSRCMSAGWHRSILIEVVLELICALTRRLSLDDGNAIDSAFLIADVLLVLVWCGRASVALLVKLVHNLDRVLGRVIFLVMLDLNRALRGRLLRLQFLLRLMLVQFHLMGDLRVRLDLWLHDWDVHRVCLEFTS